MPGVWTARNAQAHPIPAARARRVVEPCRHIWQGFRVLQLQGEVQERPTDRLRQFPTRCCTELSVGAFGTARRVLAIEARSSPSRRSPMRAAPEHSAQRSGRALAGEDAAGRPISQADGRVQVAALETFESPAVSLAI